MLEPLCRVSASLQVLRFTSGAGLRVRLRAWGAPLATVPHMPGLLTGLPPLVASCFVTFNARSRMRSNFSFLPRFSDPSASLACSHLLTRRQQRSKLDSNSSDSAFQTLIARFFRQRCLSAHTLTLPAAAVAPRLSHCE